MASSSADCVLGVARLISSARTMLAKTGPGWKRNWRVALGRFFEHLGAHDVGGHQVGRELDAGELQFQRVGQSLDEHRFAQAGHSLKQGMAAGDDADEHMPHDVALAYNDLANLGLDGRGGVAKLLRGKVTAGCGIGFIHWISSRSSDCSRMPTRLHSAASAGWHRF